MISTCILYDSLVDLKSDEYSHHRWNTVQKAVANIHVMEEFCNIKNHLRYSQGSDQYPYHRWNTVKAVANIHVIEKNSNLKMNKSGLRVVRAYAICRRNDSSPRASIRGMQQHHAPGRKCLVMTRACVDNDLMHEQ